MKKIIASMCALIGVALAFAGGIDNKTNMNAGFLRNPSRNTESKRPEAVLYNIAGTGFMENGLHFNVGDQLIFKEYSHELDASSPLTMLNGGMTYKDQESVYLFPDFEAVFKMDNWAVFLGFGIFAGGGSLNYKDGTAPTFAAIYTKALGFGLPSPNAVALAKDHSLEVYSATMGEILGGSYVINDMISLSAAGRFLHSSQNMALTCAGLVSLNGGDEIGYDATGYGFGGIFGINVKDLLPNLYLSVQYQTITKMSMTFDTLTGTMASTFLGAAEGDSFKNDLPAVLSAGIGYNIFDKVNVSTSFNYYFNKQATMQNPMGGADTNYDDSWEIGLGVDYQFNEMLGFSVGGMYSKQGSKDDENSAFNPVQDSIIVGGGIEIKPMKQLMFTASYMYCKYLEESYTSSGLEFDLAKSIQLVAIGVTFKPF